MKRFLNGLTGIFLLMTMLSGCNEPEILPTAQNIEIWQQAPLLNCGSLEYEKLLPTVWNTNRLEITSGWTMAETEVGYYFLNSGTGLLYYADKTDLSTWVPVCAKPNCPHTNYISDCNAKLGLNSFLIKNDRIYFLSDLSNYPELFSSEGRGFGLFSKAADGSDPKLEYLIEEALVKDGGSGRSVLTDTYWLYDVTMLQADGRVLATSYLMTEEGQQVLFQDYVEYVGSYGVSSTYIPGEETFTHSHMDGWAYTIRNGKMVEIKDCSEYAGNIRYMSGDTIRVLKKGDGIYDVDLNTAEEIRISDLHMDYSNIWVLLPNCILESTFSSWGRPEGEPNRMLLFDGECWREIRLTPELTDAPNGVILGVVGISSDSIFFSLNDRNLITLYRVRLDAEELVLEYCGKLE